MRKITLAVTTFFLFQLANAQVEKGSIFTGGSIGISSSSGESITGEKSTAFNWNISPQIGKAIAQNKVIGFQLNGVNNAIENSNTSGSAQKNTGHQFGVGVFYRQYFPIYKKWMFYGQANANLNFTNSSSTLQGIKYQQAHGKIGSLNASLGITYQVSKKLWLEAGLSDLISIGYNHQNSENVSPAGAITSSYKTNNVTANFNLTGGNSFAIGFRWIIPAKGKL
jgi:hypothetical protein